MGVLKFGLPARAILHGLTAVEHEVGDVVGFLLVLLQVIPVRAPQHFPVEMPGVVAGHVFAVLGEFNAKPVEGRFVFADHVALDDVAGQ